MRALSLIALGSVAAQSNPLGPLEGEGDGTTMARPAVLPSACSISYQAAFDAILNVGGECSQRTCTAACQAIITKMLRSCEGLAVEMSVEDHGVPSTTMFTERAVAALKMVGPFDCAYHQGHQECRREQCEPNSFMRVVNGLGPHDSWTDERTASMGPECADFFMGFDFREWRGCGTPTTTNPPGWDRASQETKDICFTRYLSYVKACSGCTDPLLIGNIKNVAKAIAQSNMHCTTCDETQAIADTIKQLCCVGPGNVGDSTCSPQREERFNPETGLTHTVVWQRPDTVDADGVCDSYIGEIARACPSLFHEGGWVPLQSCYTVDAAHTLQFPEWHDACPSSLVPLPSHCTPSCAAAYAPWYNRCSSDPFISHIDSQLNRAFEKWAEICRRGN